MRDEFILETAEQMRALAHPLRQRILNLLVDAPYTNKQLATILNVSPPRLHFHVRELLTTGLIEIVAEQPKGGVIEKYYRAVARIIRLSSQVHQAASEEELMETTLDAIRQEFTRANTYFEGQLPKFLFAYEPARLSPERLTRIEELLKAVDKEIYQALEDPKRDIYQHFVSISYLLHTLPPSRSDDFTSTGEEA
jgi:DNA-binding transcriptional ArsR family regulator